MRLEKLSGESLSLDEITALLDHRAIWREFNDTCVRCDRGEPVSVRCLALVPAGSLLYKNWHRPGAIVNATLKEFEHSPAMTKDSFYIMHVEDHNTATEGVAKVVMDGVDHGRVVHYARGRPINRLSSRLKIVGGRYGLQLPSATRVK